MSSDMNAGDKTAGPDSDGTASTSGGLVRMNFFDGLFLRAEHLNVVQDYARDLARSVGAASGPGVVEGLGLTLESDRLLADAGLAIAADGHVLRAAVPMSYALGDLQVATDTFWWVQLEPAEWTYGDEAVQGLLCDDPCSGGSTHQSRRVEGVRLCLQAASETGLDGVTRGKRSWLASRRFQAERHDAGGWPDPADPPPTSSPPQRNTAPENVVRLGVLCPPKADRGWQLDVWTARRDRGDPPPTRYWQWHLGMRPWDVFIAQVLQFQAELADLSPVSDPGARVRGDALLKHLAELLGRLHATDQDQAEEQDQGYDGDVAQEVDQLRAGLTEELADLTGGVAALATGRTLAELGFVELPPAGFLPCAGATRAEIRRELEDLLGDPAYLDRVCTCTIGDLGGLLAAAQHRPRLSLAAPPAPGSGLAVYVPILNERPAFGWVLFTREDGTVCPEATPDQAAPDEVDVYVPDQPGEPPQHGQRPDGAPTATLRYPAGTWAVPEGGGDGSGRVFEAVQKLFADGVVVAVDAWVTTEVRRPLGALRAALLAARFTPDGQAVTGSEARTWVSADEREMIAVRATRQQVPQLRKAGTRKRTTRRASAEQTQGDVPKTTDESSDESDHS